MRSLFFLFLLLFFSYSSWAQLLYSNKELFSDEPFFNIALIKEQKIKSITGEIHYKRDYEKMHNRGTFIQYNFDEKGRLINQISTFKKFEGIIDTAIVIYEYDSLDRLTVKRKGDAFGFYSLNYEYDEKNQVTKETYCRDINENNYQCNFVLAKQYPMAVESFSYQYLTPTQYKIKYLNNLGIAYKEVIVYLDEKGRLIEKSGRLVNTGKVEKNTFQFSENGHVIEKSEFSDIGGEKKIIYKFKYDEKGRLSEMEKFKNDIQLNHSELLYDDNSLINALLTRNIETKVMDVVKYKYEFYK